MDDLHKRILAEPYQISEEGLQTLAKGIMKSHALDFYDMKSKLTKYLVWSFRHYYEDSIQRNLDHLMCLIFQKIEVLKIQRMCSEFDFLFSSYQRVLNKEAIPPCDDWTIQTST